MQPVYTWSAEATPAVADLLLSLNLQPLNINQNPDTLSEQKIIQNDIVKQYTTLPTSD